MPCMSAGQAAVAGRPLGLEVEVEAGRGPGPLVLEVLGGATTTTRRFGCVARCCTAAVRAKVVLPAPGRGHGEEVRPVGAWKRSRAVFLPGPEADGTQDGSSAAREPDGWIGRVDRTGDSRIRGGIGGVILAPVPVRMVHRR